ncbi:receptor-type tyrosine-protein phosphatase kappa-like [Glandiceps talaboti]
MAAISVASVLTMNSIVFLTCFFCYLVSGVHAELLFWSESPNVQKDSEFVFGCFASDSHRDEPLSVGRKVYTGTQNVGQGFTVNNDIGSTNQTLPDDSGFPPGSVISNLKNDDFELYKIYMPKGQAGRVGVFYCNINNSRTELNIVTLVNPSESEANLIPSYYHKTVNTGNQVDLAVTVNIDTTADLIWRHNDDNKKDWKGNREVQIRDVTEADGGIYESYLKGERETGRQSIVLLNVRVCTDETWGENCESDCPLCYNGGMCNDEDGTCICPPGFMGEQCENACSPHYFGANCEIPCSMTTGRDNTCNGQFICQREPYGCSCVAGYGGKNCTEECQEGYYGAGCTQYCNFCISGKCDPITGGCYEGCNEGRTEPQCIDLPEFATEPDVAETTSERVKLAWGSLEEVSNFPVTGYIVWFKQSSSSDWKRKPRDGVLESSSSATVKNLEPDAEYKFYIEAKISQPYVVSEIKSETITVKTKCGTPSIAPNAITVTQSGPNNLKVEWQVQEDISENVLKCNADKAKFYILYEAEGTQPSSTATSSLSNRMHIIGNNSLTPCTQYTVTVLLFNGEKEGPRSQPAIGKTGLPSAPSPVTNLKVYQHSLPTALLAEWTSPRECKEEYVYIVRYKLLERDDCDLSSSEYSEPEYTLKGFTGNYTINGLIPYSKYKVEVSTAVDDVVGSEKSSPERSEGRTSQSAPSGPPENVTNTTVSSTSVGFKWDEPACGMKNGEITGYYALMTPPVGDAIEKHSPGKETQFGYLLPYTEYGFQVKAVNDKGTGNFSQPLMVTTLEDNPGKPKMLRVKETTNTSITLKWEIPERPNGIIIAYTILWLPLKENVSKITVDIQDKMVYKVKNLESFTEYSFCVKAETSVGTGVCSNTVTDKTMAGVPSEPADVQVVNKGQQFIDVKWDVPKQTNGHITIYQVHIMLIDRPYENNFNQLKYDLDYKENVTALQHKFSSLFPATEYRIIIQAFTILPGVPSDPIDVVTKVKVPTSEIPPPIIVGQMSGTTLEVQLQQVVSKNAPISAYKLVVRRLDDGAKRKRDTSNDLFNGNGWQLFEYYTAKAQGLSYYVTAEFSGSETLPETFIVGDGEVIGGYYNAPLMSGVNYQLHFGILSTTEEETFFVMSNGTKIMPVFSARKGGISPIVVAIIVGIVLVLLAGLIAAIFIVKYQRELKKGEPIVENGRTPIYRPNKDRRQNHIKNTSRSIDEHELEVLKPNIVQLGVDGIKINKLAEYIKNKRANSFEGFVEEFESLQQGPTMPHNVCLKADNQAKNRYINIVTYDHSRVVLDPLPDDDTSDYINANFIDGYKRMNAFIATQGPNDETTDDFWRMVWQENTETVIMATNTIERGKIKCFKYWPEKSNVYGDITITFEGVERLADFIIRVFRMTKAGSDEIRIIKQFHFIVWPDMGVPMYATAVLAFLKRVRASNSPTSGPIVVHCSAGVGRTGTFIVIDSMLDMMKAERQVDIYNFVKKIRTQRINMVQTLDQYVFIYEAVLEASLCGDTSVTTSDYRIRLYRMKQINPRTNQNTIFQEFQNLSVVCPLPEPEDCEDGHIPENRLKNRFPNIIPVDRCRPYLMTYVENGSDYINASFVDAYKRKDAFLATQMPLPYTVIDFWRMLYDHKSCSVVMLNSMDQSDETLGQYWPDEEGMEYGPFTVEVVSIGDYGAIKCRVFKLYRTGRKEEEGVRTIQQFHLTCWPLGHDVPQSKPAVVDLISLVEKWQQQTGNGPITVHCLNGLGRTGTFCAIYATIERMKVEQMVDVFQAVKKLRLNRPNMVQSLEQYSFCYDTAMEFLDSFETYANFK